LALSVNQSKPDYTGGGEDRLINVDVTNAHRMAECSVNSTLTISVGDSDGVVLSSIAGNPMALQLHAALAPGDEMNAGWVITSWCGSRHGIVAAASLAGLQATQLRRSGSSSADGARSAEVARSPAAASEGSCGP
jgi:hypothetical protein